jgi:hypothetical protein
MLSEAKLSEAKVDGTRLTQAEVEAVEVLVRCMRGRVALTLFPGPSWLVGPGAVHLVSPSVVEAWEAFLEAQVLD